MIKKSDKLTDVLKAIADPTRRAIFDLVLRSEKRESISTVTKRFKISRQGVTKHLKALENAGLIKLERSGRTTYCNAKTTPLRKANRWLQKYLGPYELEVLSSEVREEAVEEITAPVEVEKEILEGEIQTTGEEIQMETVESEVLEEEIPVEDEAEIIQFEQEEVIQIEDELEDPTPEEEEVSSEEEELQKGQLMQMSLDPRVPSKPVETEPAKAEPVAKEPKEKPIEVTDNQLDIYGIRKEPKVNEKQQLEMF